MEGWKKRRKTQAKRGETSAAVITQGKFSRIRRRSEKALIQKECKQGKDRARGNRGGTSAGERYAQQT